jgi:hypothetical protein
MPFILGRKFSGRFNPDHFPVVITGALLAETKDRYPMVPIAYTGERISEISHMDSGPAVNMRRIFVG